MPDKSSLLDFRFAIGEPGTRQSSVWHARNHKSDVYVTHGKIGGVYKLSVHATSPYYFYGLTDEYAKQHLGGRRNLMKWSRSAVPPRNTKRAAHVVWAVFPTDYLGPDGGDYHGVHWIPAAPAGQAVQIDMILTMESRDAVEESFLANGRRLEEHVVLPNGQAFAVVSSIMSDWQNKDLLLRGGPDFANVAFLARDEKGSNRSEIICFGFQPKDQEPLRVEELWGNHVPANFPVTPTMRVITGQMGSIRGHRKPGRRDWSPGALGRTSPAGIR